MIRFIRHQLVRFLALLVGLEAVVVMIGWVFGIDSLTRLIPFGINMKFMTAFLFFMSAMGLYFISYAMHGDRDTSQIVLPGIVLTIFTVTVTLFASRLLGTPTGIEQIFVPQPNPIDLSADFSVFGWPSFLTLIGFTLFGLAGTISLFPSQLSRKIVSYIGICTVFIGSMAIIGYVCDVPALYYDFNSSAVPMAFNTAILFALLGAGLLVAYQDTAANEN